ncbi:caspase family protein [Solitalea lacus]|uniref:caspase family protein n=1 Tax=Solitalea lacus TaxID=2911172 RepID=UPI001EDA451C|nr:caspase family protein [Solitalea lacus]UKJ06229.1 caspase family protein [Solitalea lacus]
MSRGISLHIGLNHVDTSQYPDYVIPELFGCINDANSMKVIAQQAGFTTVNQLIDGQATAMNVLQKIEAAASQLCNGDIFLLTYSGHGGQVPDETGEEEDGLNETWILYDRQLIDNELYNCWQHFAEGVRIFVLSDSCHSGSMVRMMLMNFMNQKREGKRGVRTPFSETDLLQFNSQMKKRTLRAISDGLKPKNIPIGASLKNYILKRELYQNIQLLTRSAKAADEFLASLIYISGCQDNQLSGDGDSNGIFTGRLLTVWQNGAFTGDYPNFYDTIIAGMPADQSPNYMTLGSNLSPFEAQKPFTVLAVVSSNNNSGGGSSALPCMVGPASWCSSNLPPCFNIDKAGNPQYYVEFATDNKLFNAANESERTAENFYASYSDAQNNYELEADNTYTMKSYTWDAMKNADQIFYRIGSTIDYNWNGWKVSFSDEDYSSAPSFQVIAEDRNSTNGPGVSGEYTGESSSEEATETVGNKIEQSVGKNGTNQRADVKVIQKLLKQVDENEGGTSTLLIDGICGPKTIAAIKKFQTTNELNPSGLFRPGTGSVILLYIKSGVADYSVEMV